LLEGKVAVVTGAASGLGQAMTLAFAEAGARVLAVDINPVLVQGAGIETRRCDISDIDDVGKLETHIAEQFGTLDALCNKPGYRADVPPYTRYRSRTSTRFSPSTYAGRF
jgi:NAD(P)-dependent dehydrogenase (short-subunit alcohol dehydrogenase family)